MILSPWPMILRSLPITDLAPTSVELGRRCTGGGCGAVRLGPALLLIGSSFLGSAVELRVNICFPGGLIGWRSMPAPPRGGIVSGLGAADGRPRRADAPGTTQRPKITTGAKAHACISSAQHHSCVGSLIHSIYQGGNHAPR